MMNSARKLVRIRQLITVSVVAAALTGCGIETPLPDTARVSSPVFGSNGDSDIAAINLSSWAFARPANTRGDPADAARALAAVDYLAGELSSSPRWAGMSPLTKVEMLRAREQVRQLLRIRGGASSQSVVDALNDIGAAIAANDSKSIQKSLHNKVFEESPDRITRILSNLPYLDITNIATQHANSETNTGGDGCAVCN
jgi:hypothetical protein